jgi:hypothetical protein
MAVTEQEALDSARHLLRRERRELAYPVSDIPVGRRLISDPISPQWEFYFKYQAPVSVLVDPTCARIVVDSVTGEAHLFSPRDAA